MKKFFLPVMFACSIVLFSCGNAEQKKQDDGAVPQDTSKGVSAYHDSMQEGSIAYVCPCGGCPEVRKKDPGNCPKCGIEMVQEKK